MSTGGYVRHRERMIQESVFQDIDNTLIACRWKAGTTTRKVVDPEDPGAGWQVVTTAPDDVLPLVGEREDGELAPVVLIDYFPEAGGNDDEEGRSRKTEVNTLAVDQGVGQEPQFVELGSNMQEQPYVFTLAFFANSDAVAMAVMNDLKDRYMGRIVSDDNVDLLNYNATGFDALTAVPVVRMEVETFRITQGADSVNPWEANLHYAELTVLDVIDGWNATNLPRPTSPGSRGPEATEGHGPPPANWGGVEGDSYLDLDSGDVYDWSA